MTRYIIDIESSDLLQNGLDYSSLPYKLKPNYMLWCVVLRNIDTDEVVSLRPGETTYSTMQDLLADCEMLVGHNIVAFDLPVLKLLGVFDYEVGYPGEASTVFGKPVEIYDTLLWSRLLNPDRYGGHSLGAWGESLGHAKIDFHDFSRFSEEMLTYCIQDTSVNRKVFYALEEEKGTWAWQRSYSMEVKLADLTLKQELFGFKFDSDKAKVCLEELDALLAERSERVKPLLPLRRLTKGEQGYYTPPKIQFKKNGDVSAVLEKWCEKVGATVADGKLSFEGKVFDLPVTECVKQGVPSDIDDINNLKGYLLDLGWKPSEWKERDLTKNSDKTSRNHADILKAIARYVEESRESEYREHRCDLLNCDYEHLEMFLISKIDGSKPLRVPTTPCLRVGVEKELCPNLEKLGEKATFVKDVVEYFTYRHRRNSIAGGVVDEDGEPISGFLSNVREDGRIPTPANTLGANTGRYRHSIVCNIPRVTSLYGEPMRSLFGPGHGLWQLGFDFASLEARIQGHFCIPYTDGKALAEALVAEKPNDIHSLNAKKLGIDRSSAKSFSYACLPMQTRVLTSEGWKYFHEIKEGESLPTFDENSGTVKMDKVLKKHFFTNKEVVRYANKNTSFECTEDHRWYGWRRSKTKGKPSKKIFGYFEAKDFTQEHNLVLTAPYVSDIESKVTVAEAKLLGYILSDGCFTWSKKSLATSAAGGKRKAVSLQITQSENKFHKEIEELLVQLNLGFHKRKEGRENGNDVYHWTIAQPDARAFLDRTVGLREDKHDINWTKWLMTLSSECIDAFYEGFYNGDGDVLSKYTTIAQNTGSIHEAIVAASQLLGRGRVSLNKHDSWGNNVCEVIRTQQIKHLTMQEQTRSNLGVQDTFCLTTGNGSFIIWQDKFVGITGNCLYGAQPKKLSKMLGVSEAKAKQLFNDYWDAVPALKELKDRLEAYWESKEKKFIVGMDGRKLMTRSKHSLTNVCFQSGGAVAAKWSTVYIAKILEEQNLLGNPFEHSEKHPKVWQMICMHDEVQYAVHRSLMKVVAYKEEDVKPELSSAVGHGSKGDYIGHPTEVIYAIRDGIAAACKEIKLRVELGFEWIPGLSWGQCH